MKKNIILISTFIFAVVILFNVNKVNASVIDSTTTDGEQEITVGNDDHKFKGTLYKSVSIKKNGFLTPVVVNRLLIDKATVEGIVKQIIGKDPRYEVNIADLEHKVVIKYHCEDNWDKYTRLIINYNTTSLSTNIYGIHGLDCKKLFSTSPTFEKGVTKMFGAKADQALDLFYIDGKYSVRGLALGLNVPLEWDSGITRIKGKGIIEELPGHCNDF